RLQNFELQFLKEATKFVGDFKSLAKEANAFLAKHKILELDIERLLKAVVSQDIISVVQNASVVDTSDLQTELERTKKRFENCIIKKEAEYAKLWNDWYKKCDECKYDKISYDKAYKDMQQKIERLQAQLGDLKGKCKDTSCVSDTQNQVFQKLENANMELEFQVFNYAKENAHLKATYKNLSDFISVEEILPIVNQVDARVQNFEIQFLKEAAKFVGDFKSLAKEADASLAKYKILELEIERLLKAIVSQDIISIVQVASVVDTSDLHTELERMKKCDECKYDKISYDKAYKDMQQKIERLQAQLGVLKGKSKDTSCVSNTQNPLSQKLENANVELEFRVLNYARENAHLKATYKNLFDSISVSRVQTETKIASLQNKLQCNIYKNAKLRMQLYKKVSDQKYNTQDSRKNTKFAKQPIE
nr:hypothetical protein [Tanacetum cinerariifolium]